MRGGNDDQTPLTAVGLPMTAACLRCGYPLHHLSACRCPECGRAFNAADPRTWRDTARGASWLRQVAIWSEPPTSFEATWAGVILTIAIVPCWGLVRGWEARSWLGTLLLILSPIVLLHMWRVFVSLLAFTVPARLLPKRERARPLRWTLTP